MENRREMPTTRATPDSPNAQPINRLIINELIMNYFNCILHQMSANYQLLSLDRKSGRTRVGSRRVGLQQLRYLRKYLSHLSLSDRPLWAQCWTQRITCKKVHIKEMQSLWQSMRSVGHSVRSNLNRGFWMNAIYTIISYVIRCESLAYQLADRLVLAMSRHWLSIRFHMAFIKAAIGTQLSTQFSKTECSSNYIEPKIT